MVSLARILRIPALILVLVTLLAPVARPAARDVIARAALTENMAEKRQLIDSLAGDGDEAIVALFEAWKRDSLFIHTTAQQIVCRG